MPPGQLSENEMKFHRSFLDLKLALEIWNEDYRYQNTRGGPPNRQKRRETDPVYAYHVHQGPHYPSKPPGDGPDKRYNALLTHGDGNFEGLVIITKRGLSGQNFPSAATPWELKKSVLCGGTFKPIVNAMMEVTGHYGTVRDTQLIRPAGIVVEDFLKDPPTDITRIRISPEECIENEVPLYLWEDRGHDGTSYANVPAPEGWRSFARPGGDTRYHGGIDVMVLPNGEVIGAKGRDFASNNGHAESVISPLDFWAPGSRLLAAGIRALTSRMSAAAVKGLKLITTPSKELALLSASRFSKTLPGVAVSTRGLPPVEHLARRTFIMGEDLPKFRGLMAQSQAEAGFYDVVIHGNSTSFRILMKEGGKEVWKDVSVKEVAAAIGPRLAPGDKIRLLACDVGTTGGPAQQLANELNRTVWSATTKVPAVPQGVGAQKAFVPRKGGKFHEFVPERGAAKLSGNGGKVTGNEVKGEINPGRSR